MLMPPRIAWPAMSLSWRWLAVSMLAVGFVISCVNRLRPFGSSGENGRPLVLYEFVWWGPLRKQVDCMNVKPAGLPKIPRVLAAPYGGPVRELVSGKDLQVCGSGFAVPLEVYRKMRWIVFDFGDIGAWGAEWFLASPEIEASKPLFSNPDMAINRLVLVDEPCKGDESLVVLELRRACLPNPPLAGVGAFAFTDAGTVEVLQYKSDQEGQLRLPKAALQNRGLVYLVIGDRLGGLAIHVSRLALNEPGCGRMGLFVPVPEGFIDTVTLWSGRCGKD